MNRHLTSLLIVLVVLAIPASSFADDDDLFRPPETAEEFWSAIDFQIDIGKYDQAASLIAGMLAKNFPDAELVALEKKTGMTPFLRLRLIPRWIPKPLENDPKKIAAAEKEEKTARDNVDKLIERVTEAVRKEIEDPTRINKYIANLSKSPEEFKYAVQQLYRSGPLVIPYMIDAMRGPGMTRVERIPFVKAMTYFSKDIVPPLLAALDSNEPDLQLDIFEVIDKRGAVEATPYLWYWMAAGNVRHDVRLKATLILTKFLKLSRERLPAAKVALTKEAEKYYLGRVTLNNANGVTLWRWDGKGVVAGWPPDNPKVSETLAEEYYGVYFAKRALALDPTFVPAQEVMVSLLLDKNYERFGLAKPLTQTAPDIQQLLLTINPETILSVLDRALSEDRERVIVGAIRILGDMGETKALFPSKSGKGPLVRALDHPSRRVQFAAAEAMLAIPGSASTGATGQVIEILERALATKLTGRGKARVLVGYFDEQALTSVGAIVQQLGYDEVKSRTGREMLQRLQKASDIDLLIFDADIPNPMLASVLGQLKSDRYARRLPIILSAAKRTREEDVRRYLRTSSNITVVSEGAVLDPVGLRDIVNASLAKADTQPLSAEEAKEYRERSVFALASIAQGVVKGYDVTPAKNAIFEALRGNTLSPEAQFAAIAIVSKLSGPQPQTELLNVILDDRRDKVVQTAAAHALNEHIQQHSLALNAEQSNRIVELVNKKDLDAGLRLALSKIMGAFDPNALQSGTRLLNLEPIGPAKPKPPMPPKPPANPAAPAG